MIDWIDISCDIAGKPCTIVAHREYMPDAPQNTYLLTQGLSRLGSVTEKDGKYVAYGESSLTQSEIDAVGEQINNKIIK